MKYFLPLSVACLLAGASPGLADEPEAPQLAPRFEKLYQKLREKPSTPEPSAMLLNTDPEPDLSQGFVSLYNGKNLDGWVQRGADNLYHAEGEAIVGTYVPPQANSYLCTVRDDFTDFIFTVEFKWLLQGNSGIQFRSRVIGRGGVQGPQVELEEAARKRGWTGGVYGQGLGGFLYPLWLDAHQEARQAVKFDDWNRITIHAEGATVKTWVNGVPCAHFQNEEFLSGYFALQVHKAEEGLIHFRNILVKEL
ncbi:MAG: DUF1080 domain-containing protein [Verrucomicrobiota bacterium]